MSLERRVSPELSRQNGVRILLAPNSQVSEYVKSLPDVGFETTELKDKVLTVVTIDKAEAGFFPGGIVGLRVDRQRNYRIGFNPATVLEIQTQDGELI